MFLLLTLVTDSLLVAVVGARAVSSAVNFLVNRRVVFEHGRDRPAAAAGLRYFSLVIVLLAANYGLLYALDALSVAALPAKILAEIALLTVSYVVQQRFLLSANPPGTHGRLRTIEASVEVTIPAAAVLRRRTGGARLPGVGRGLSAHLVHVGIGLVVGVDGLSPAVRGGEVAGRGRTGSRPR